MQAGPGEQLAITQECERLLEAAIMGYKEDGKESQAIANIVGWLDASTYKHCHGPLDEAVRSSNRSKREAVLEIMRRTPELGHIDKMIASLGAPGMADSEKEKVARALRGLTGQELGTDRSQWESWLESNSSSD